MRMRFAEMNDQLLTLELLADKLPNLIFLLLGLKTAAYFFAASPLRDQTTYEEGAKNGQQEHNVMNDTFIIVKVQTLQCMTVCF